MVFPGRESAVTSERRDGSGLEWRSAGGGSDILRRIGGCFVTGESSCDKCRMPSEMDTRILIQVCENIVESV